MPVKTMKHFLSYSLYIYLLMRLLKISIIAFTAALTCSATLSCGARGSYNKAPVSNTLIELFTSEGCSSCPKADKTVADLQQLYKNELLVLCYHVDYWNHLGWKDVYSSAENTKRQQFYVSAFHLTSAYTPQAVINGTQECVGSDKEKLVAAIKKGALSRGAAKITTTLADRVLGVSITGKSKVSNLVCLVQKIAVSQVMNGENQGRKLEHINLVRDYVSIPPAFNSATFNLPPGFVKENYFIAVLQQDDKTGAIASWSIEAIN